MDILTIFVSEFCNVKKIKYILSCKKKNQKQMFISGLVL